MDNHRSLPNELLEAILTQVNDMQTILLAQRVCQQWALCIRESTPIQQILFFRPAPASGNLNKPNQQNPLLAKKFPYWFPANDSDAEAYAMAFGAGDMQDFLEISDTYRRPEASWRRMLVQQPPIMALGWVERSVSLSQSQSRSGSGASRATPTPSARKDLYRWEIPLQELGGLRMNMLYDLVVHTAEVAPEYFYFRVLWSSQSKTLRSAITSNFYTRLDSDPCPISVSDRVTGPLRHAMQSADVVLDMWFTSEKDQLGDFKKWWKDTWTWELVRGLKLAMDLENFDVDLVRSMRELKDVFTWTLADEWSDIRAAGELEQGYTIALPDDDDLDL